MIPNYLQLPAHLLNTKPDPKNPLCRVARRRNRRQATEKRERALRAPLAEGPMPTLQIHEDFYPDYREDWIDVTEEARQDYLLPTPVANVPSRVTNALDETVEQAMATGPKVVRQAALAIKDIVTELHEYANTVHGGKDLLQVQNRDVFVLAIKNWWQNNPSIMMFFLRTCARSRATITNTKKIICSTTKMGSFA